MSRRWLALVLALLAIVLLPRGARADQSTAHSVSVAVLALDSDDAEEQADALTGALRSRIRASQGWSLVETSQSLGMLTAALRCPGKPIPADCEQRIADQIKSDRYIFGYVTKASQTGQVTAEIHLYQKNKPDTVIRESYAETLKDQNDDALRKIAQRLLDRLGGTAVGTIVVRLGNENGEVIIDGDKRVPLQNGTARLELAPGGHSVEVAVAGQPTQKKNVLVAAGKETVVDLAPATPTGEPPKVDKPFPTRKVVGAAAMIVGAGLGVLAIERRFVRYPQLQDEVKSDLYKNTIENTGTESKPACEAKGPGAAQACEKSKDAEGVTLVAGIAAGAGALLVGTGIYLFFFGNDASEAKTSAQRPKVKTHLTPNVGYGSGGLSLSGSF